jgi:hypothetical protein
MTAPEHTTEPVEPAPVGKLLPPLARQLAETMAVQVGACIRPLALRRTDSHTGRTSVIPIPCGATRESKCPPCADRARRLRIWQAREGWHLSEEPAIETAEPTVEQLALIGYRADLEAARAAALEADDTHAVAELDQAIDDAETLLRGAGVRGSLPRRRDPDDRPRRRVRSTRRRQDVPDLPRKRIAPRTTGQVYEGKDGRRYQPSIFVTLTMPSYGPVHPDGAPVDPTSYDYRRAARDAIHFGLLVDRVWQNLRRAAGWNVQYFGVVEPQKRGAPHLHAAIRGTLPRSLIREVVAATYHQVWWPPHDRPVHTLDRLPIWDETRNCPCYVNPDTGQPLPSWEQALDEIDEDPTVPPAHVARFGTQVDIQGVLGGTEKAGECLGYLVKYLTKSLHECHQPETDRAAAHVERFVEALRYEPCSERCANWLLYGVQPEGAKAGLIPGRCKRKAHKAEHLGYAGRRCLVSRKWSGKNLTEHRDDRRTHVLRALGAVGITPRHATEDDPGDRYLWQPVRPTDPDQPDRLEMLMRSISERRRWREQYERARDLARGHPATDETGRRPA